ncbi:MAG: beta-hydroxyacyl-ACP dehydratase [Proteobacteria bacterium]|jgi:3-hydroxymyristoyl/3-hydroxydecanoyl-(acyl carrier protein) dehydratase|nr:beta-hydroxyacyl-ACP dehydratase [Pseudomonadota bacterium]
MRYFFVDRIEELKKGEYAVGTKCISLGDDCFEHHYPTQPVYPGSLIIEAMAQLGGALIELTLREKTDRCPRCVMSSVKAKFRKFVRPGDRLSMRAEIRSLHEDSALIAVAVTSDDERICEAEFIYVLITVDDQALETSIQQYLAVLTQETRIVE